LQTIIHMPYLNSRIILTWKHVGMEDHEVSM